MVAPYQQAQLQQAYAAGLTRGAILGAGDMGYAAVPTTAPQAAAGEGGLSQLALAYPPGSLPTSSSGLQAAQVYYDTHGAPVTLVPYWQQQQSTQQQQQQAQQQQQHQQLWQPQQQQHQQQQQQQQLLPSAGVVVPSPVHCQGAPAGQYAAPVLLSVSEGFPQVMQVQQGSWQQQQQGAAGLSQQQQPQQQQSYMAAGYDISQVQGVAGIPASGPLTYTSVDYAQQQQSGLSGLMVSSVAQVNPAAQQLPLSGGVQQGTPALTGRSSVASAGNVLLGSSAGSSSSSAVGPPLLTYQQLGSHHSLSIPLSAEQLSLINSQLSSVAAMSGTSITAEHNFACGSLAVNVVASSQQQLSVAWQFIQSLLGQQGSTGAPAPEGLM